MRDDEKKKLHENLKQEIRSLLISSPKTKYGGLSGSLLYSDYQQLNCGKEVPYVELGFHSFLALLRSMPDVVEIEFKENSFSYRVHPIYNETTAHIQKMVLEQRDKYEYENELNNQNWHSMQTIQFNQHTPVNLYCNGPFLYNSLPYHTFNNAKTYSSTSFHPNTNRYARQTFDSKKLFPLDRRKVNSVYEPYLLLTPVTPLYSKKPNENLHVQSIDRSPYLSNTSNNDHKSYSTPNTFIETPPNFSLEDYHLNESIKDVPEDKIEISLATNQIIDTNDDPLLQTSTKTIVDNALIPENDQLLVSPSTNSITSSTNDTSILPAITDDISEPSSNNSEYISEADVPFLEEKNCPSDNIFCEISHYNEDEQCKNIQLIKRINDAIRQCLYFRYIHRLYELKFEYRYYPSTIKIISIISKLENKAFNEYQQELEAFEKMLQIDSSIDDQICQTLFDEYVYLQRNYYYMSKLMKKQR